MKNFRVYFAYLLLPAGLAVLQSCSNSRGIDLPSSPTNSQTSAANILSAYATLGSDSDFEGPDGIQYSNGHLWVANSSTFLQEWTTVGGSPITTIWSYNSGVSFFVVGADGIDPATGNVYTCDWEGNQIPVFDSAGNYLAVFGHTQMSVTATSSPQGFEPYGVAVNQAGTTVYATGQGSTLIDAYSIGGTPTSPTYTYQFSFGNFGTWPGSSSPVHNLRVDSGGNVWVADTGNHRLAEYGATGNFIKAFTLSGVDVNFSPMDVLLDGSGNVYGLDYNGSVVVKFSPSGKVLGQFGQGILTNPLALTTDGAGNFFVTNGNPQQIVVFH